MAEVSSITAARAIEIENNTISDAELVDGYVTLKRYDGTDVAYAWAYILKELPVRYIYTNLYSTGLRT